MPVKELKLGFYVHESVFGLCNLHFFIHCVLADAAHIVMLISCHIQNSFSTTLKWRSMHFWTVVSIHLQSR